MLFNNGIFVSGQPVRFAKIITIADIYDAMTSSRIYRKALCPFHVVRDMEQDAFTKFDPKFSLPFLKNVATSYIGNNVKLSDGRTGLFCLGRKVTVILQQSLNCVLLINLQIHCLHTLQSGVTGHVR